MTGSISQQSLAEFVRAKLFTEAERHPQFNQEETLWYAGNVLVQYLDSSTFHDPDPKHRTPILAHLFNRASHARSSVERTQALRNLGDTALFIGALLPGSLRKRGLRSDYLVGMGGGAYSALSANSGPQTQMYSGLAEKFPKVMEILSAVCDKELMFDTGDVVALYERWEQSGSALIKAQLESLGITPFESTRHSH